MKIDLNVVDLRQFLYCPRVVFYQRVMGITGRPTYKMIHGQKAQDVVSKLEERRKLNEYGLESAKRHFKLRVFSEKLGLSGYMDLVLETDNGVYPVDFKETSDDPSINHILQLGAYSLLLEDYFNKSSPFGFIYRIGDDKIFRIDLGSDVRSQVSKALFSIQDMIKNEMMPPPAKEINKCQNCEFRNFCRDVF